MKRSRKQKAVAFTVCLGLLMGQFTLPSTLTKAAGEEPEQVGNVVYLHGNDAIIEEDPNNAGNAIVKSAGKEFTVESHRGDDTKTSYVYAGGETGNYGTVNITMNSGKIDYILGSNKLSGVVEAANITMNNGDAGILHGSSKYSSAKTLNDCKQNTVNNVNIVMNGGKAQELIAGSFNLTYVKNASVTLNGGVVSADTNPVQAGILGGGTNGITENVTVNINGGSTKDIALAQRAMVTGKATVNVTGGSVGNIYAGSYYDDGDSAAGSGNWSGWGIGGVNYGQANAIDINVGANANYDNIYAGFQFLDKQTLLDKYGSYNYGGAANIVGSENIKAVLNLSKEPTNDKSAGAQEHTVSMIDSKYATTNWVASNLGLSPSSKELEIGKTLELVTDIAPSKATVTYASSDESVVTVDDKGTVKAISSGTATITATSGKLSVQCIVTVPAIKVDTPTIDPEEPVEEVKAGMDASASQSLNEEVNTVIKDVVSGSETSQVNEETAKQVKEAVEAGKTISLAVETKAIDKNKLPSGDEKKIEAALSDKMEVAQYLDLSLDIMADGSKIGTLDTLKEPIKFTLAVPTNLKKENRVFSVIRLHDGKAEKLATTQNEDGTLSFETDKFSTYALVYEDTKEPTKPTDPVKPAEPAEPTKPAKPTTPTKKPTSTVSTGDQLHSNMGLYLALMAGALVLGSIVIVLNKKEKLNHK